MKQMISLLLTLVLCFGLAACGSNEPEMLGEEVQGGMTDEHVAMVTDAVKAYMETDSFKEMEAMTEYKGVKSAMYYRADGAVEGIDLQLLLMELDLDAEIVGWNRLLAVDLRDGTVHDVFTLDMNNYMGQTDTYEDLMKNAFGGFDSYLMDVTINLCVMTELEVRTPATDAQIGEINAALGK